MKTPAQGNGQVLSVGWRKRRKSLLEESLQMQYIVKVSWTQQKFLLQATLDCFLSDAPVAVKGASIHA